MLYICRVFLFSHFSACLPIRLRFPLLATLLFLNAPASAAALIETSTLKQHWGNTLAGLATTVALHELGHFVVAETEGANAWFDGITVRYHNAKDDPKTRLRLASAGFQSQWLASEYAFLRLQAENPGLSSGSRAFHTGMVLGHLGISLAYLTVLKSHEDGDSLGIAKASGFSEDKMLLALTVPALLDGWRLFGKAPEWAPLLSRSSKAVGIVWSWTH